MKILLLIAALMLTQGADVPQVEIVPPVESVIHPDTPFSFSINVNNSDLKNTSVRVMQLNYDNLKYVSSECQVHRLPDGIIKSTYLYTLRAPEPGVAKVSSIQVELTNEDTGEVNVITKSGFSLQVSEEMSPMTLAIIVLIAVIIILALIFYIRLAKSRKDNAEGHLSPLAERHQKNIKELEQLSISGQWRKVIDMGYGLIIGEIEQLQTDNADSSEITGKLENDISQLGAANRLGEEVRFGGFEPGRSEAKFMIKVIRELYEYLQKTDEKVRG